jgi:hypothetical protein
MKDQIKKSESFPCDACGQQVEWARSRKTGKTYLAEPFIWEGDQFAVQKKILPAHWCQATPEQKAEAAAKRAEAKATREAEQLLYRESQFFAEAGTKFELEGEITFIKEREGFYGEQTIIEFAAEGRGFTWVASGARAAEFTVGQQIKIKGTVKGQEEKYGKIRTLVTRCKIG